MPRRSVATVRDQPVELVTSLSGAFTVRAETFTITTTARTEVIDLTERVMSIVRTLGVREGTINLASMHTTCTLFINEFQVALRADILQFLEHVVKTDAPWLHNDPDHSDCDRANADSHLRAMIL